MRILCWRRRACIGRPCISLKKPQHFWLLNLEKKFWILAFIHANIKGFDAGEYDHFYFFNAFFENINDEYKIDNELPYSKELYNAYNRHLYKQLNKKPAGTRLVTFHSTQDEIPDTYHEVGGMEDEVLKFWMKE
jgi:hypothetical protein